MDCLAFVTFACSRPPNGPCAITVHRSRLMSSQRIPFVDMQARIQAIRPEILESVERVLDSCVFVMGAEVRALEEEFARFCQVDHGVAVSNGTAALQVALMALGVGPGDEVITAAN